MKTTFQIPLSLIYLCALTLVFSRESRAETPVGTPLPAAGSKVAALWFAGLAVQPTREELEARCVDGLLLCAVPEKIEPSGQQEAALAAALKVFELREKAEDGAALESYIAQFPNGAWTPALRVTCGRLLYFQGRFSEALAMFQTAWAELKQVSEPGLSKAAVSAAAEQASLYARLGMMTQLGAVLAAVKDRPMSGSDTEKIRMAAEGYESMQTRPEISFKCGPYALANIRTALGLEPALHPCISGKASTVNGISLQELEVMAGEMQMDWVAARRVGAAELPVPALVHWKVGHYAAVTQRLADGRLLVRDPTFLHDFLISPAVFDEEASGNFLIPRSALGSDWQALSSGQAAAVLGKGAPSSKDTDDSSDKCPKSKNCGMAGYDFDFFKAGLIISDVPLGYAPAYGPAVDFSLTYRQRTEQVLDASAFGFGAKWSSNFSAYLQQSDSAGNFVVFLPGGEKESHTLNLSSGSFDRQKRNYRKLVKTSNSPVSYELFETDGSKQVFSRAVASGGYPRYLLSSRVDAQGLALTFSYNAANRLTAITDALGQTSNLYYENVSFPHLVTKISDPFTDVGSGQRRSALFQYDSSGRLTKITDAVGIASSFTYDAVQPDFIASLTTPYGTTTFTTNPATYAASQYVEATDPLGRKERVEYRNSFSNFLSFSDPTTELPDAALIQSTNNYLYYGNTLYWDKKTYVTHPPNPETGLNYDKAERTKWMWHPMVSGRTIGAISSVKKADQARIWYEYEGQILTGSGIQMGTSEKLLKIGQRISATETQVEQYQTDEFGNTTQRVDPFGRTTKMTYAANGMDLLSVTQKNGAAEDVLATFTYHPADPPRRPRSSTDASGQVTSILWNARGQVTSITQPGGLLTSIGYTPGGFPSTMDGPLPGTADVTTFTQDLYGRTRSTTRPGGHVMTFDYDALDRPTQVTFPDGSTEQFSYQRPDGTKILDLTQHKDRENRRTLFGYNALRQRTGSIDPLGRATVFHWCYCGALQDLYDAENKRTHWDYDITGRVTRKVFPDGREINYAYEPLSGRLASSTDAKGQVKHFSYYKDNQLMGISYTNAQLPTPNVSFTYEAVYGRLSQMTDGSGSTQYTYHPSGGAVLGAGMLASIDGPLVNDTITQTYDALGRMKTLAIHGAANTTTVDAYDALSRVTSLTHPLGTFTNTFDPVNLLPKVITAPNGLRTEFSYQNAAGDLRLAEIKHTLASANISTNNYAYRRSGNIKTWTQAKGANPAQTWSLGYDKADQLETASLTNNNGGAVLASQAWRYDKSGNITSRQNGGVISQSIYNNRNQLVSQQAGGFMRVRGTTNESTSVKVKSNGNPFTKAQTDPTNQFSAWVPATPGQNTITIEAKDDSPNANTKTQSYTFNVTGQSRIPGFDLNGNTTASGTGQTYAWDAEDRLVKITYADNSKTEFSYDGSSRRTRISEKTATNTITSDRRYLWAGGTQPAEERDATGAITLKQYFGQGEKRIGGADAGSYFYTQDHLGSIREITDSAGTLRAQYDYDFWGKRVKLSGTLETEVGYTGHHHHAKSGLVLTHYRAYNPELGTWLSPDPIGEMGGLNLYGYVGNDPVNGWDPLGLDAIYVHYDGYPITTPVGTWGFGHAAVVSIDDNGVTNYSEFGRYSCPGKVRRQKVPNVKMGPDGKATPKSLKELYDFMSRKYGKGHPVSATYSDGADSKKIEDWINKMAKSPPAWDYPGATCKDFAKKAIQSGSGKNPIFGPQPGRIAPLPPSMPYMPLR